MTLTDAYYAAASEATTIVLAAKEAKEKKEIGDELVTGWNTFWGAVDKDGKISTVLMVVGGAIMAWFLVTWLWKKSRGGGGGGNALQGFPWWPMAVGLVLTAPTFLIPLVLKLLQSIINVASQILTWTTTQLK